MIRRRAPSGGALDLASLDDVRMRTDRAGHPEPKRTLPALTGARFFAALFVMLFHFGARSRMPAWLVTVLEHGRAGVSFFFVLSGFCLPIPYAPRCGSIPLLRAESGCTWFAP